MAKISDAILEATWGHIQHNEPVREIHNLVIFRQGKRAEATRGRRVVKLLENAGRVRYIPRCGWVVCFRNHANRSAEISASAGIARFHVVRVGNA